MTRATTSAVKSKLSFDEVQHIGLPHWTGRQIAPDRLRPAGVLAVAPDNVQMHLRHDIAQPGEVDLGVALHLLQPVRQQLAVSEHLLQLWGRQVQQIRHPGIRHQDEPVQVGIARQQQLAAGHRSQLMAVRQQLWMQHRHRYSA